MQMYLKGYGNVRMSRGAFNTLAMEFSTLAELSREQGRDFLENHYKRNANAIRKRLSEIGYYEGREEEYE